MFYAPVRHWNPSLRRLLKQLHNNITTLTFAIRSGVFWRADTAVPTSIGGVPRAHCVVQTRSTQTSLCVWKHNYCEHNLSLSLLALWWWKRWPNVTKNRVKDVYRGHNLFAIFKHDTVKGESGNCRHVTFICKASESKLLFLFLSTLHFAVPSLSIFQTFPFSASSYRISKTTSSSVTEFTELSEKSRPTLTLETAECWRARIGHADSAVMTRFLLATSRHSCSSSSRRLGHGAWFRRRTSCGRCSR